MQVVVISDHVAIGHQVQQAVLRAGFECPTANRVELVLGEHRLAEVNPSLVVVVLSPDPSLGLAALAKVRARTQARLLAVGPASQSRLILEAVRHGASDYIDEDYLDAELDQALQRVQTDLGEQKEAGKVIGVLAPNGGSGSSTLATNLATVLAKHHEQTMLLDLKLESGDLAALLDVKPVHTLADLCRNVDQLDRIMFERSLIKHESGVQLLAPPRTLADVAEVTIEGIRRAIIMGRSLYPYVVIDLDHSYRPEQLQALQLADEILVVMRLDFVSLRNTRRTLDYLQEAGIKGDRVRVVVNRYGQPKELAVAKAEEALGVKVFHLLPEDAKYINRAMNNGVPVVLETPSSRFSKSLAKLAVSVNGRPPKH